MSNRINAIILGDLILDTYITGAVHRISPEAPVPVLFQKDNYHVLGGALNVVENLISLGAEVHPFGVIGEDKPGEKIIDIIKDKKISTDGILISKNYTTTEKTRFASNNHHLLRVDNEKIVSKKKWDIFFKDLLIKKLSYVDFILVSDYGKGVCSEALINSIIKLSNKNSLNVFIDPKGNNYSKYRGSFCITPNKIEAESVLNTKLETDRDFEKGCRDISKRFNIKNCIITRGSHGLTYYDGNRTAHLKAKKVDVFDVSGAGDTFISCLAYHYTLSKKKSIHNSCKFANDKAGQTVQYFGTKSI